MNKVIFVRGIQGSGKSTWAKAWVNEDPTHRVRISWDDIRRMFGPYWIPEREELVRAVSKDILFNSLIGGYDVVIDNMNLSEKSTSIFKEIIEDFSHKDDGNDVEIIYQNFKTPLEECLKRNVLRQMERIA